METRHSKLKTVLSILILALVTFLVCCCYTDCDCEDYSTLESGTYTVRGDGCPSPQIKDANGDPVLNNAVAKVTATDVNIHFDYMGINWTLRYDRAK
ncbi:MAG: hypothetical protein JXR76_14465 [Deltaproteobacteria bacterium]|nr:hypothetical protein [Deltaproteobacteria bacterium]